MLKVVCTSDTHNRHDQVAVPPGDVFVHAGDATMGGTAVELEAFNAWLGRLPHRHKVVVAGNHDWIWHKKKRLAKKILTNAIYLEDRLVEIEGLRIYGAPWQPEFCGWAFNVPRGRELAQKWALIQPCDLLVTHGPPAGILDVTMDGHSVGCEELAIAVRRVKPAFHAFGHIHEGYGWVEREGVTYANVSACDARYRAVNPPFVFEWNGRER